MKSPEVRTAVHRYLAENPHVENPIRIIYEALGPRASGAYIYQIIVQETHATDEQIAIALRPDKFTEAKYRHVIYGNTASLIWDGNIARVVRERLLLPADERFDYFATQMTHEVPTTIARVLHSASASHAENALALRNVTESWTNVPRSLREGLGANYAEIVTALRDVRKIGPANGPYPFDIHIALAVHALGASMTDIARSFYADNQTQREQILNLLLMVNTPGDTPIVVHNERAYVMNFPAMQETTFWVEIAKALRDGTHARHSDLTSLLTELLTPQLTAAVLREVGRDPEDTLDGQVAQFGKYL
ncbi:MAG TPA: hypothetical protein VJH97_02685 [Candidatus Nanoarchaeia archaeon]|nr:hypothetical protein [Candidatus Nanoarchaeia archaeon]